MRKAFLWIGILALVVVPLAAQTVTVSLPSGGDVAMGSLMQIAWTSTGVSGGFRIQLIRPGGSLVVLLMPNVAGSPQSWTVAAPALVGEQYRIRVRALNDSATGESAVFTVISGDPVDPGGKPTLRLLSPNGGKWTYASTQNITWAANWGGKLKLELWSNGSLKGIISDGVDAASGSFPWVVGQLQGGVPVEQTGGYSVRAVRKYAASKWTPIPRTPLQDETVSFSIVGSLKTDALPKIVIVSPGSDRTFYYGDNGRPVEEGVKIPFEWNSLLPGVFQLILCDETGHPIRKVLELSPESQLGPNKGVNVLFRPADTPIGVYRVKIQTEDLKHSALTAKFTIKVKNKITLGGH
jgi:hypothetical protein